MIRTDVLTPKRNWHQLGLRIDKTMIVTMVMGFFLARVNILNDLAPFGFAFLAANIIMKGLSIPLLLSVAIGTLSLRGYSSYILAYFMIYLFFALIKEEKNYSLIKVAFISTVIFLCCKGLGIVLGRNFFIYDLFVTMFESVLVFTIIYIFSFSLPVEGVSSTNSNNEKKICSFITIALTLAGIKEIGIFGVEIKNLISIMMILFLAYNQGAFIGGTTGIILGMVAYISRPEMPFIIGIFGISGLLAGIFKDLGKLGSVLGLFLGNGIISFYINGLGTSFLEIREILVGSILFLIITKKANEKLADLFSMNLDDKKNYTQRRDEIIVKKLNRMVDLFYNLSTTFKEAAEERDYDSTGDVYNMVDAIANGVCTNCYKYETCWKINYYNTYQKMFNLAGLAEIKTPDDEDIYQEAKKFCIRPKDIIVLLDRYVERFKLNESWKLKLKDNRILLSEQLESFGRVIENIGTEIYSKPRFNQEVEENLYKELKNNRIDVKEVTAIQIGEEDFDIFLDLNTGIPSQNKLKEMITSILGYPVVSDSIADGSNNKGLRFKLIRHNRFSAMTNMATIGNSENKVSGDSFTFGEVEGIHFSAISDGMGIGRRAKAESKIAVSLLERLMEAKVDKDLTLKTINSVLRAKSNGDMFTTLDLGFIDLYSGKLQMIKTGAPATFIKKKDRVDVISSGSLPVGLLKDVDFNIYEEYMEDGDIIIMMSDGILEVGKDIYGREAWMKDVIMDINSINPQNIANEILNRAKEMAPNSRDDMTVLVTKVWKNIS